MNKPAMKEAQALIQAAEAAGLAGAGGVTMVVNGKPYRVHALDEKPEPEEGYRTESELLLRFAEELRNRVFDRSEEERLQRIEDSLIDLRTTLQVLAESQAELIRVLSAPVVAVYDKSGKVVSAKRDIKRDG